MGNGKRHQQCYSLTLQMVVFENLGALACTLYLVVQVCQARGVAVRTSSDIYFRGRICQRVPGQELQKRLDFKDEEFDKEGSGDILHGTNIFATKGQWQHHMPRIDTNEVRGDIFAAQTGDVFQHPSLGNSGDKPETNPLDSHVMENAKEKYLMAIKTFYPSYEDYVGAESINHGEIRSLSNNYLDQQLNGRSAYDTELKHAGSSVMFHASKNTTRSHRPYKHRRGCHEGPFGHQHRHSNEESGGRRRGRRTATSLGTQSGFVKTSQQPLFRRQCEFHSLQKMLPDGSYPQYVRSGTCKQSRCMGGMYRCRPVYRQLRVLRRVEGMCVPLPQETWETPMEEEWTFTFERVVVGCNCALWDNLVNTHRCLQQMVGIFFFIQFPSCFGCPVAVIYNHPEVCVNMNILRWLSLFGDLML